MTEREFGDLLATADPDVQYASYEGPNPDYTYWIPSSDTGLGADDGDIERKFVAYVDRFTRLASDPMVGRIYDVLKHDEISRVEHTLQYESDTKLLHHTWRCEVVV